MEIFRLPVLNDNYIFLLFDRAQKIAAVVDPAIAAPVLEKLAFLDATLVAIFNTHHHSDHVGGNRELKQKFPGLVVYGGKEDRGRIPEQEVFLVEGDQVKFGNYGDHSYDCGDHRYDCTAQVYFVPGHTRAHIAYYFAPLDPEINSGMDLQIDTRSISGVNPAKSSRGIGDLFCGDTIFSGGCGRLREGTPAQMVDSLGKLRQLPDNTRVWCAHEYTLANLQFALTVDGDNSQLQARFHEVEEARSHNQPTIPTWLGIEKQTNPFLRWDSPTLQARLGKQDAIQTFTKLRGMKDLY